MTYEEAYETITNAVQGDGTSFTKQKDRALYFAQKAMEKQMPKKPTANRRNVDTKIGNVTFKAGVEVYLCPNCNEWVSKLYKCCDICGQALDWSGEK